MSLNDTREGINLFQTYKYGINTQMILQVSHFQLSSSSVFVNFGQNERFSEKHFFFLKKINISLFSPQNPLKIREGQFATTHVKKIQKKSALRFLLFFFHFFKKKQKISNLSRDKAPEFQNNVIVDMKTALDCGKKVKTQLFRRRRLKKIQKESYLISKKLQGQNDPPLRHPRVKDCDQGRVRKALITKGVWVLWVFLGQNRINTT